MRHLGHSTKGAVYSGQFRDIKQALIYMLDKPGFNFPLRSGDEVPRPTTILPYPRVAAKAAKADGGWRRRQNQYREQTSFRAGVRSTDGGTEGVTLPAARRANIAIQLPLDRVQA